ncbi:hypothetical protein BGP_4384 [Beggiatoa sp. PS]|nr:hypothetical protein BGP_4384 [Beggiatoa sp. PS]
MESNYPKLKLWIPNLVFGVQSFSFGFGNLSHHRRLEIECFFGAPNF